MRTPLVAGNWKMNGSAESIEALLDEILSGLPGGGLSHCEVLVFPSYPYLDRVAARLEGSVVGVGSQDIDEREGGAVTGGVSASMVRDMNCNFAIVGHSERRTLFGEDDQTVADKFEQCLATGLTPILCVGETLDERQADATMDVVIRQLNAVIDKVGAEGMARGYLAYEPVWAIGTGESATPEQAEDVHAGLRARLAEVDGKMAEAMRVLYGGSVNAENAEALFAKTNVDGALVGGAALKGKSFIDICQAADASVV